MLRMHLARPVALTSIFTALMVAAPPPTQGATTTIAITGQSAPDTIGNNGLFGSFSAPVLNREGQVAFNAFSMTGTSLAAANDEAIYLGSASGLTQVARESQLVPFGNGQFSSSLTIDPLINDFGQVAFTDTNIQNTSNGSQDNEGIYIFTDNVLAQARRRSTTGVEDLNTPSFSNSGRVAVVTRAVSASSDDTSISITTGSSTLFAQINEGGLVPDGNGEYGDLITSGSNPVASNTNQQVALRVTLTNTVGGGSDNSAIVRSGGNVIIAREGQAVSGGGTISGLTSTTRNPVISQSGQVAFLTALLNTPNGSFDNQAIYRGSGGFLSQIAREGQNAPGAPGTFGTLSRPNDINVLNQVVFEAALTGTLNGSLESEAIYRGSGGTPTEIVRENDPAPDGNGVFNSFSSAAFLNDTGQVVLSAGLRDTSGVNTDDNGIFMGDGQEVIRVVREGQALAGSTVATTSISNDQKTGGNTVINNFGQVAFQASLLNGDQGVFLFTPELHYRRTFSSSWDTSGNWTVGLKPAEVHDVMIDTEASVTITGPGSDTTLKSLQIGGGIGIATLDLDAGSTITPLSGVLNIESTGILTGDGAIDADVTNNGNVIADNLTVTGTLTNHNTIHGSGRIAAPVVTSATGRVLVNDGDELMFAGSSNTSSGLVDVNGQGSRTTLEFTNGLINNASGQIDSRGDTEINFGAGLNNNGLFSMSFADATVRGSITNNSSIGIAFTNAAFSQGDLTNIGSIVISNQSSALFFDDVDSISGNIHVESGSTAVFFGSFNGSTSGSGTVTIHGDLQPGASPGISSFGGDLVLGGGSTTLIELGGLIAGSGFDQLDITGNATLNGTLEIDLINAFAPDAGDSFDILNWGSLVGSFSTINLPKLGGDLGWDTSNLLIDGTLSVISAGLLGDLDGDGFVGINDLNIVLANWNQNVPPANPLADPSGDGFVGIDDLNAVLGNWNAGTPPTDTANIPEPGAICLLAVAGLGLLNRTRPA